MHPGRTVKTDIRRVLAPLRGRFDPEDPQSLEAPALQISVRLARHLDARIEVLSVIGPVGPQAADWISWVPDCGMGAVLDTIEKQGVLCRKRARKTFDAIVGADARAGALEATLVENPGEIGVNLCAAFRSIRWGRYRRYHLN